MKIEDFEFPNDLKYNDDYSWIRVVDEDNGIVSVGISDFGAKLVKQFVFIDLPEKGKRIKKGDTYVSLESIKWSGHLKSPVSGEIMDVNEELFDEPERINKEPYKSWIIKVKLDDKDELNDLMDSKQVVDWAKKKLKNQ